MKLHVAPPSSCSRRVLLTTALLGPAVGPIEEVLVDLRSKDARSALRALNPNEKIPVLEDGDFVLWESHAIMQYLCDRVPGQTLYPTAPRARADVQRWLLWVNGHLAPPTGGLNWEHQWKLRVTGLAADPGQVERHEAGLRQALAALEQHLLGRPWIVGDGLTLADLSVAATLMYAEASKLPLEPSPRVRVLCAQVHALPAWEATNPAVRW